jgi:hypothetical protein
MRFDKVFKFRLRGYKEGGKINSSDLINFKFQDLVIVFLEKSKKLIHNLISQLIVIN